MEKVKRMVSEQKVKINKEIENLKMSQNKFFFLNLILSLFFHLFLLVVG